MVAHQATECAYEVDADWVDRTRYLYKDGDVVAVSEPFAPVAESAAAIERVLQRFRFSVPGYELLERRRIDHPVPGAELLAHRLGGDVALVEVSVFWPVGDTTWAFRVQGPPSTEARCRAAVESFLETYQPVEAP